MPSLYFGIALATAALCMFSLNILLVKVASDRVSLNLGFLILVTVNLLFCGLLLGIQMAVADKGIAWSWAGTAWFVLAGVFSTYLGRWFFFEAVVQLGAAKASLFQVSSPGFAALIAWIFMGESLSAAGLAGIVLTMAGLMLIAYVPGLFNRAAAPGQANVGRGAGASLFSGIRGSKLVLGMGGSVAYAIGTVLRGAGIRSWNEPLLGAFLGAATGLLLHAALSGDMRTVASRMRAADPRGVRMFVMSGILTISAQICSIWSLRYLEVSLSNLISLCTPLLVIPGGYFLFKEKDKISLRSCLGGAMAIVGVGILILLR
jgi:drug/metabolite transporter (DMT)-like permease